MPRSYSGGEEAEEEEDTHFLRPDYPNGHPHHDHAQHDHAQHDHPRSHHHHHHRHNHRVDEEEREERARRWSTGDRLLRGRGRGGGDTPPLPLVSDSHSIVGGFEDAYDGGPGYQRTLHFHDKQPLQVRTPWPPLFKRIVL